MKWFKRFSNGILFDLSFIMALASFCYYVIIASMVASEALTDHMSQLIRGDANLALFCFLMLVFPAFILFGLFYTFWNKSRLDSHEEVIVEELLED